MRTELNIEKALTANAALDRPQWYSAWQKKGEQQLEALLWPTRKTEHWKYTPLKSLTSKEWQLPSSQPNSTGVVFEHWQDVRIDIRNGVLIEKPKLPEGVSLACLSECDAEQGAIFLEKIESQQTKFEFDSVNQALLTNGFWLKIQKNVKVTQPIHLNFINAGENTVVSTQVLVEVEQGAQVTIAETFSTDADSVAFVNGNSALLLGENAKLTHYHLLLEEGDVRHVGRVTGSLDRFANLNSFHMAVGGVLKRKDITLRHRGEGAQISLNGVYLPKGKEVIDYHTTLEHEVPNCQSSEIFRGIIGDHAKAVFNGRIHIHKDAQKSIAEMNNRNLLLSDHAEIDTKPELEIYADDVRCAHGATIAQLDQSLLFYFQARGISKKEAEVMLSFGFINELLDGLADEPVQLLLRPMLANLFATKQADLVRHIL